MIARCGKRGFRSGTLFLGLPSFLLLCGGCANHLTHSPSIPAAHWKIALAVTPASPRQMDPAQLRVRVTDRSGKPVSGAQVVVQLAMPSMDMGLNQVTAIETASGTYRATGRFTMPGAWRATVQVGKTGAAQYQSFPITVR